MSITRIIVLGIIVGCAEGFSIQTNISESLTLDAYLGPWYDLAMIFKKKLEPNPIQCQFFEVTPRGGDDDDFYEVLTMKLGGKPLDTSTGYGTIDGTNIRITYGNQYTWESVYRVTRYNHGKEMILYGEGHEMDSVLISRNSSLEMISREALADFQALATRMGGIVNFISNDNCE